MNLFRYYNYLQPRSALPEREGRGALMQNDYPPQGLAVHAVSSNSTRRRSWPRVIATSK